MPELGGLPAGYRFPPLAFTVTPAEADAYRQAVGDESALFSAADAPLPPLLLVARALRLVMEQVGLPPGTLHGGQEGEFLRPAQAGRTLRLEASAPRAATRQGMRFITLETSVFQGDSAICRGRATLIVPQPSAVAPGA